MKLIIKTAILFFLLIICTSLLAKDPPKSKDPLIKYYSEQKLKYDNNLDSSIYYVNKIYDRAVEIKDTVFILRAYWKKSALLYSAGNFDEALRTGFEGIKLASERKDTDMLVKIRLVIGAVYGEEREFKREITMYEECLTLIPASDLSSRMEIYSNLVSTYNNMEEPDKALEYGNKALELNKTVKDAFFSYAIKYNMALAYRDKGNAQKALATYLEVEKMAIEQGDSSSLTVIYKGFAYLYIHNLNDPKKALEYLEKYKYVAAKTGSNFSLDEVTHYYADAYYGLGNYKLAATTYRTAYALHDSIKNIEKEKNLNELEKKYKGDKKQEEINQLNVKKKADFRQKIYLFGGLALALLLLIALAYAFINKQRYAKYLKAEDEQKALLLKEVHHRVNNNLQIVSSLLAMESNSSDDEKTKTILEKSQNRIRSLSFLHKSLYSESKSDLVQLDEYLGQIISFHANTLQTKNEDVDIRVNIDKVAAPSKKAVSLGLVVNELLTNIFKYAFAEGFENAIVQITLAKPTDEGILLLTISDNGIQNTTGGNEGFGTQLIKAMVKQLKGEMAVETGAGRKYLISFKV